METRELYKQKYGAQLREWTLKIEVLEAQATRLTAQAKLDMKPHLDALHGKAEAAKAKLHDVGEAADDKWEDVKKSSEHAWSEMKAAVEGAVAAIRPHTNG